MFSVLSDFLTISSDSNSFTPQVLVQGIGPYRFVFSCTEQPYLGLLRRWLKWGQAQNMCPTVLQVLSFVINWAPGTTKMWYQIQQQPHHCSFRDDQANSRCTFCNSKFHHYFKLFSWQTFNCIWNQFIFS